MSQEQNADSIVIGDEVINVGDRVYVNALDNFTRAGRAYYGTYLGPGEAGLFYVKPDEGKYRKQAPLFLIEPTDEPAP